MEKYREKTNSSIELAQKGLEVVLNKNTDEKITNNKKLFTVEIKDEELQKRLLKIAGSVSEEKRNEVSKIMSDKDAIFQE